MTGSDSSAFVSSEPDVSVSLDGAGELLSMAELPVVVGSEPAEGLVPMSASTVSESSDLAGFSVG